MVSAKHLNFFCSKFSQFVPKHNPIDAKEKKAFITILESYDKMLILTGAGVSTESGIPDYRSEEVGLFSRSSYKPIYYTEFVKNEQARVRYWARNYAGWPKFSTLSPNINHFFISHLESEEKVIGVITQNVDGLHSKAGSQNVIELHGNAFWVKCLKCHHLISRNDFQQQLKELNPTWEVTVDDIRPDGDVDISAEKAAAFKVADCEKCGGLMKPTVVFFGENVPAKRVQKVEKMVENCNAIIILGTSLSTLSSYRIVTQAYDLNKFICIVNIGPTRADKMANLIIQGKCSEALKQNF